MEANDNSPAIFTVVSAETVEPVEEDEHVEHDSNDENSEHESDSGDEMPRLEPMMARRLGAIEAALRASLRDPDEGKPRQESTLDIVNRVVDEKTNDGKENNPESIETNSLRDNLTCVVCQEPMFKPTTLLCQHSFCYGCLEANNTRKCPTCRMAYVLPAEYNRSMDDIIWKCFPKEHRQAKIQEELHKHAKDARTRIEEELRRELFRQAAAQAHVEVSNLQENRREPAGAAQRASAPVPAAANSFWDRVKAKVPKYAADVIFNPGNVIELLYRASRYGTFMGLGTLAGLFTLVFTVREFSRLAGIFMVLFILAQIGVTSLKGLLWFATHAIRKTMIKAVREVREADEQQAVMRQNRAGADGPVIFAGGFGPNGVVFPPGQQPPPELRNMLNALNSLAQGMHSHQH